METINKSILIYGDSNYRHSANYSQSLYNFPITLNYGELHNRTKYIIHAGTSDSITLFRYGIYIYVVSKNFGLSYCSLQVINTETKESEESIFLDSSCEDIENILLMSSEEQLKVLLDYIY
jgi:hypothetical protein